MMRICDGDQLLGRDVRSAANDREGIASAHIHLAQHKQISDSVLNDAQHFSDNDPIDRTADVVERFYLEAGH